MRTTLQRHTNLSVDSIELGRGKTSHKGLMKTTRDLTHRLKRGNSKANQNLSLKNPSLEIDSMELSLAVIQPVLRAKNHRISSPEHRNGLQVSFLGPHLASKIDTFNY